MYDTVTLQKHIMRLHTPDNYLDGVSSHYHYNPQKTLLFSRKSSLEFVNNNPIIHHRFNMVISIKGSLDIYIDNNILTLNEGEAILIFPYQNHHYISSSHKDLLWCFIGFDLKERRGLDRLRYMTFATEALFLQLLERLFSASDDLKSGLVSSMLYLALDITDDRSEQIVKNSPFIDSVTSSVQKIIYSDMSRNYSVDEIAHTIGISESKLFKTMRKEIGLSPGKYIRQIKMNYACSLIESGKYNISEVAYLCGYDSNSNFSRSFKSVLGFSPTKLKST